MCQRLAIKLPHTRYKAYGRSYDEEQAAQTSESAASNAREGYNNEDGGGAGDYGANEVETAPPKTRWSGVERRCVCRCSATMGSQLELEISTVEDKPTSPRAVNVGSGLR